MINIYLTGQAEKLAADNPLGLKQRPLYHQMRTVEALEHYPLVVNAYNTGTGKTRASLLQLKKMKAGSKDNVLFIAPTNELLQQHFVDICKFVDENELNFRPVRINAELLKSLGQDSDVVDRGGEKFVRLIRSNGLDYYQELGIAPTDHARKPLILVTNPDLFYYALFYQFSHHDQRNLFQHFVRSFRYIVIDEFHYYNSKQLANFLFFMTLSKAWGYFNEGRRICLLSATPDGRTKTYLDRLFTADGWALISPATEPPEAAKLDTVPTLSPLKLELRPGKIDTHAQAAGQEIRQLLADGLHGALIANALSRINLAYDELRGVVGEDHLGRITGAQPTHLRHQDQFKPLILATPTVDIGYNFEKLAKNRQNLDFIIFEARFHDECIQRMGRAGRVLGKPVVDVPSTAVALVGEDTISKLSSYADQTFTRPEFAALLVNSGALPEKDDFHAYLSSGALLENAYPIFKLKESFPKERADELEALFESVREVYSPERGISYSDVVTLWNRMHTIGSWLHEPNNTYNREKLPKLIADYHEWLSSERPDEKSINARLNQYLGHRVFMDGFRQFCEMEYEDTHSLFSFRDSFSGPTGWVYDRQHLLSGSDVTQYDLIHLAENYELEVMPGGSFTEITGDSLPQDAIAVRLLRHRKERNYISLCWRPPEMLRSGWLSKTFEKCFAAGKPVAIRNILLQAQQPLPSDLRKSIADKYVLALFVPERLEAVLRSETRHRAVYSRKISVALNEGDKEYDVLLGSASILMAPLLYWAFMKLQRDDDAIIL